MAGNLLIIGLTLFLMGTVMLAMDAQHRGRSPLMFALPFTGSSYIRHYWSDVWLPALLRLVGVTLVVMSVAVAIARDPLVLEQPRRIFGLPPASEMVGSKRAEMNTFANSREAVLLAIRSDSNPLLSGRVHGRSFAYDEARLINGVLSFQQGDGFIPEMEVRILLDLTPASITEQRQTIFVRPADETAPELHISWRDPVEGLHTEIYRSGYQMELQITRRDRNNLIGFLQVILPGPDRSYLAGEFVARTDYLRYVNNRVDLTYDHPDTLKYVARQYLETQFPEGTIRAIRFSGTRMLFSESGGVTIAQIELVNGRIEERVLPLERAEIGWAVRPGQMETRVLQEAGSHELRLVVPGAPSARQTVAAEVPPPITLGFEQLDTLTGQQAEVHQTDGRIREGVIRGLRRNRLLVESIVGGGVVELTFAEQDLSYLVLVTGQRVNVGAGSAEGQQSAGPAAPAVAPGTPVVTETAAPPEEQLELSAWRGKQVRITSRDTRVRTGIVTEVSARQLTLNVRAGAGELDYFYSPSDIVSIEEVRR
jgi:hypothetical protein